MGLRPAAGQTATARIAVVGAGLAGLTAAYRLKQAGFNPVVFEGNTRLGGRCFTARGAFQNGQIVERGGEFIDTDHYEIRGLAKELGLTLYDVLAAQPPGTIPVYRFNGERYTLADATADFGQLYLDLKGQSAAIGGSYGYQYSIAGAKRYDAMTARQWIVNLCSRRSLLEARPVDRQRLRRGERGRYHPPERAEHHFDTWPTTSATTSTFTIRIRPALPGARRQRSDPHTCSAPRSRAPSRPEAPSSGSASAMMAGSS